VTSVAVEKDEISKAELVRVLEYLASVSHDYEPAPFACAGPNGEQNRDEMLVPMNEEWRRRFGHLMIGGLGK
jgi:hypothetical protein